MHAYIYVSGPGNQTHYPDVASAMLYQLNYRGPHQKALMGELYDFTRLTATCFSLFIPLII